MMSSISSIPVIIPNYVNGNGKLSYPVQPDQVVVAQFKHIFTFASSEGVGTASVMKLRVLDNLIEQLGGETGKPENLLRISGDNADSLIARLSHEIAIKKAGKNSLYGNLRPGTGIVLDLYA